MIRRYPKILVKMNIWIIKVAFVGATRPQMQLWLSKYFPWPKFWIPSHHLANSELQMSGAQYPKFTFQEKFLIFQLSASCFETFKKSNSQYMAQIRFRSCFTFFKQMKQSFFKARYSRLQSLWNHQYCKQGIFRIHIFDLWTNYEICTRFVLSEALQKHPVNFGRSPYAHF